jgi:hypothetical protein
MKKSVFIFVILTVMFAITGCPEGGDGPPPSSTRKFWAQNVVNQTFYQLDAELLAENSRCEVWVEKGNGVTAVTANNVANAYNTVYAKMMNTFGYNVSVSLGSSTKVMNTMELAHYIATGGTSGAKLTILLLDIRDGYNVENDPYVGGYFYAVDLYKNNPNDSQFKYSNQLDMIYIDTYPSVPGSRDSNGTLAHEMQHLMNFVTSYVMASRTSVMETWIDEGLSSAAEWVYLGDHSNGRWQNYNDDHSGLIKKGNNFYVWGNRSNENKLANLDDYATVYLFFQYLRLQANKPDDIYFDIITSEYIDYNAVIKAKNINSSHNGNWQLLLRDWHAANFTNAASGLYGYMNDSTLKKVIAPMVPGGTNNLPLYPGEGVYSKTLIAESVPSASGNIKYAGLSPRSSTSEPNNATGYANGARLTYNVDASTKGSPALGNTTGIAPAPSVGISIPGSGSVQIDQKKFTGPFKVDASYFLSKNGKSIPENEIRNLFNNNNSRSISNDNNTLTFDLSTLERVFIDE